MGEEVLVPLQETSGEQNLNTVHLGERKQSSPVCPAQPGSALGGLAGAAQESSQCQEGTGWPDQEGCLEQLRVVVPDYEKVGWGWGTVNSSQLLIQTSAGSNWDG